MYNGNKKTQYAVEVQNVCKTYQTKDKIKYPILNHLSFKIQKSSITAILGPSGTGKTTIAKVINGLLDYDSGKIFINGVLLSPKTQSKIRKQTAFIFQNFNLFPNLSVLNNIIYSPIKVYHKNKNETIKKAKKLLQQFNLLKKYNCMPSELSGGQKQRVAIIRALMLEPEILIMDEPTASLDPELTKDVVNMLKIINKSGITVIIITHDMIVAKKASDQIIVLHHGKCVDNMPTEQFFNMSSKKSLYGQKFLNNF